MVKFNEMLKNMNFKRTGIIFAIICVIFFLAAGGILYYNFSDRISEIGNEKELREEKFEEEERQIDVSKEEQKEISYKYHEKEHRNNRDDRWEYDDLEETLNLTTGEKVLLCITAAISFVLFAIYWLLVLLFVISKSLKTGADPLIFGIITFFFNIGGIITYYIYKHFSNSCRECGKIQRKGSEYCNDCGKILVIKCKTCGAVLKHGDAYCNKCGAKL